MVAMTEGSKPASTQVPTSHLSTQQTKLFAQSTLDEHSELSASKGPHSCSGSIGLHSAGRSSRERG